MRDRKDQAPQNICEIDVGGPVGVDGSHVSPVGARIIAGPNAGAGELMGHSPAVFHDIGNDVLAEVMARVRDLLRPLGLPEFEHPDR